MIKVDSEPAAQPNQPTNRTVAAPLMRQPNQRANSSSPSHDHRNEQRHRPVGAFDPTAKAT
jgi:hypothetical protein